MLVKSISLVAAMSLVQDLGYNRQHTVHEFAFTRCLVIPEDLTLCEMKCELVQDIYYGTNFCHSVMRVSYKWSFRNCKKIGGIPSRNQAVLDVGEHSHIFMNPLYSSRESVQ